MNYLKMNTGAEIPQLGLGTISLNTEELCDTCIGYAIDQGYRLIDTAAHYYNTQFVGKAINSSGVPREEIFLISKLQVKDNSYEGCLRAVDKQLTEMKQDYIDLMLIHHPYGDVYGAYRGLEEFYEQGLIKAFGVSNFEAYRLMDITYNNYIPPAAEEIELNPYCQEKRAKEVMKEFGIVPIASMPLAKGYNNLFEDESFRKIGEKYGKTPTQVVLRWHIQTGNIVIPGSKTLSHIKANFEVFDFELTPEEMDVMNVLDTGDSVYADRSDPQRVKKFCKQKTGLKPQK